jgi:ATP-dependent Clp protease ATP-binding subunit ClpA
MTSYTDNVLDGLIEKGIDTVKGARGMSKIRRDLIETKLADIIINTNIPKGSLFEIDYKDDQFVLNTIKPAKKIKTIS